MHKLRQASHEIVYFAFVGFVFVLSNLMLSCARQSTPPHHLNKQQDTGYIELKSRFERLCSDWSRHCFEQSFSSDICDYLDNDSYRSIVKLGKPAIPLIMSKYESDDGLPWGFVLQDITGENFIDDPNYYKPSDVKKRCFLWWDKNKMENSGTF